MWSPIVLDTRLCPGYYPGHRQHTALEESAMIHLRIGRRLGVVMSTALLCQCGVASAQAPPPGQPPPPSDVLLPPVLVTAPPPVASSSEQLIPGKDFEVRPQGRPADVLRLVPGLIIGQHQGGGKAEQYLIRGFDADHGTDLAIFVDGLPVNLRSHAHGQGYADLHFLIPETVKLVDVLKGPYFPEYGDFDTAAVVNFVTKDFVDENTFQIAGGSFNTQRYLALLSPTRFHPRHACWSPGQCRPRLPGRGHCRPQ
jgi:outer membrane receptor protein involved in Fe transport